MDAEFNFLSTEGDSEVVKRNCRKIISILGAHKVALWFYDGSTNSIGFSDDFFKNLGLEEIGIQYDTYEGFIHSVHPNDVVNYLNVFHSIMSGAEQMLKVRFRTIGLNEQTLWLEDSLFTCPECKDASAPRIIGYRTNITNRVEEENRTQYIESYSRKIIDAFPDFGFIFDNKYKMIDVIASQHINLFHTREELIGHTVSEFYEPEDAIAIMKIIDECLSTGTIKELELKMTFNEVVFHFQARYSPFSDHEVLAIIRDVTEKVKQIEALEEARKKAEEAERLKTAFLASVSHEIRTPLNAILGFSELITMNDLSPEEKNTYASLIRSNSDLFLKLINDIIDFSQFEATEMALNVQRVEMTHLIRDLYELYAVKMKPGVKLIAGAPNEEIWMQTDLNRVTQVMHNFITNAIKNTDKGDILINLIPLKDNIKLSVSDTGKGIPADKLEKIFEMFEKVDEFSQGIGLGLPIAKRIVQRLGGRIEVDSELGKGSTFSFYLPWDASLGYTDTSINLMKEQLSDLGKIVLVVDPDKRAFLELHDMLANDLRLAWARSADESVRSFVRMHPAIVLMSMELPDNQGWEAVRKMRQLSSNVRIVGVFERTEYNRFKEALAAGCNEVMTKPYSLVRLNSIFSRLL